MRVAAFSHLTLLVILCHCASAVSSFGTPRRSFTDERFDFEGRTPSRVPRHYARSSGDTGTPRRGGRSAPPTVSSNALAKPRGGDAAPRASPVLSAASPSGPSDSESAVDLGKYHLIWSPNFARRLAVGLTSILLITKSNAPPVRRLLTSNGAVHHACHSRPITGIVLPLLSSSCCALQLAINAVSGLGCAGFNTVLGPVRPYLLSVMLYSTWRLIPQRSIGWTASSLILSFLPELLHVWNEHKSSRARAVGPPAAALPVSAKLRLEIPTMGCVACVNKIDTSIRQCGTSGRIIRGTSWLDGESEKGGKAEVLISGSDITDVERIKNNIMDAVKGAGFDCTVESLVVQ